MSPDILYKKALEAKESEYGLGVVLVLPKKFKRPKGFPRGDFLSETEYGVVYDFNADKILIWLKKNGYHPTT